MGWAIGGCVGPAEAAVASVRRSFPSSPRGLGDPGQDCGDSTYGGEEIEGGDAKVVDDDSAEGGQTGRGPPRMETRHSATSTFARWARTTVTGTITVRRRSPINASWSSSGAVICASCSFPSTVT